MAPGTEFARDFCAGIGPLQLGVVLVVSIMAQTRHFIGDRSLLTSTKIEHVFTPFRSPPPK